MINQFIRTPKVEFLIKKVSHVNSQMIIDVDVTSGSLNRGDVIVIGDAPLEIENVLLNGNQVDNIVKGESGSLVMSGKIPVATVTKITIEESKKSKPVGKLLLDKDLKQFEKVGFSAIKGLSPRDYTGVLKAYIQYKAKEAAKKCKTLDDNCLTKIKKYLKKLLEKQSKYCKLVKYKKECKEALVSVNDYIDSLKLKK